MPITVKPVEKRPKSPFVVGEVLSIDADGEGSLVAMKRRKSSTVYDVASGKVLLEHVGAVSLAAGRRAIVGQPGKPVEVVALDGGTRRPLIGAKHGATALGSRFAWNLGDDTIETWDLETGKRHGACAVPGANKPSFSATRALPDGHTLIWLDARFGLHVLDFETSSSLAAIKGGVRELPAQLHLSRDGKRAAAIGSKGSLVVFDLEARAIAVKKEKLFPAAPKLVAWLDDGRFVVESKFVDIVDPASGKRRTVGARDPNREAITSIIGLEGSLVAVLVQRIDDPKTPFLTTRFFEIWDVDAGTRVASTVAADAHPPLTRAEDGTIFVTELAEDIVMTTSWRAYRVNSGKPRPRGQRSSAR